LSRCLDIQHNFIREEVILSTRFFFSPYGDETPQPAAVEAKTRMVCEKLLDVKFMTIREEKPARKKRAKIPAVSVKTEQTYLLATAKSLDTFKPQPGFFVSA
jgi:hypothetical protein